MHKIEHAMLSASLNNSTQRIERCCIICCRIKMWTTQNNAQQANMSNLRTLGMTSAISTASPKEVDIKRTEELEMALKPFNVFETEAELNHRMVILGKLYSLVKEWIKDVSIARNMPENVAEHVGGKIYTFGSYRLGVSCNF